MLGKIQSVYWRLVPHRWRPGRIWYRLKCFFWHRYTTVKPRYLPHTWCDKIDLMPHLMFELLSEFIEKECSPGPIDWSKGECKGKNVRAEYQRLYDWWHNDYVPNHEKVHDEWARYQDEHATLREDGVFDFIYDSPEAEAECHRLYKEAAHLEVKYAEDLTANLHTLVDLIPWMWT